MKEWPMDREIQESAMSAPTESPEDITLTPLESLVLYALALVGCFASAGFAASLAAAYWLY